ncbi:MAG: hypothetical protein ACFFE6_03540 [Candidatus Thorarchaeota archaeon]
MVLEPSYKNEPHPVGVKCKKRRKESTTKKTKLKTDTGCILQSTNHVWTDII